MTRGTVLVMGGTGNVGAEAVNFLSRSPGVERIVFVGRNEAKGSTVRNNTVIGAALGGFYPSIEFRLLDITDEDLTVDLIKEVGPDVIINSASTLSMFQFHGKRMMGTGGYFMLRDLAILHPLKRCVRRSGTDAPVVNVGNPDNTHYILSKVGLGDIVGAGTIDLTVQGLVDVLSMRMRIPMHNFNVTMIAHVSLRSHPPVESTKEKVPYFAKVLVGDRDISGGLDLDKVVSEGASKTFHVKNISNATMTAASAVRSTLALLNNTGEIRHGAGIDGMVGGTPVRLSAAGAEMLLPEGMTREDAFEINRVGMNIMGIEKVKDDGTIVFTDRSLKELEEALNLSWKEVKLKDVPELVEEYVSAYRKMIERLNP